MEIVDPAEHDRKIDSLIERIGCSRELADRIVTDHEERLAADARIYNAWLMNKLIVRLSGAQSPRLAAFSVALALNVRLALHKKIYHTTRATAELLGIDESLLADEVRRSADWMEATV